MSFQVPKEYEEPKETFAKMFSFWLKPRNLRRFATVCSISNVEKASVLRFMVKLFLNDNDFQEKVLRGVHNG